MDYSVYVKRRDGGWLTVATTRYQQDAEKVLTNWHAGYITHGTKIISTKNFDPNETIKENP